MRLSIVFIALSVLGCSEKKDGGQKLESKGVVRDTCSFCAIDSFRVKPCETEVVPKMVIDYPVAIEFFNQANFINKYQRTNYDTVIKVLKMKHRGDRNQIYHLTEQRNYYLSLKDIISKNSIVTIDTLKNEQFILFLDHKTAYTINVRQFYSSDGVLMYTPGKEPIFWTMKRDEENCAGYEGIVKWYFLCHDNIDE